jgi:hypothetical protein
MRQTGTLKTCRHRLLEQPLTGDTLVWDM